MKRFFMFMLVGFMVTGLCVTQGCAQTGGTAGEDKMTAKKLELWPHNGIWDSRDFTEDAEYFHTLQFYADGTVDFSFCFKGPNYPYASPIVATYYGTYTVNDNELALSLVLKDDAKLDLPLKLETQLWAVNENDGKELVLSLLKGDLPYAGLGGGQKAHFAFYSYPPGNDGR